MYQTIQFMQTHAVSCKFFIRTIVKREKIDLFVYYVIIVYAIPFMKLNTVRINLFSVLYM